MKTNLFKLDWPSSFCTTSLGKQHRFKGGTLHSRCLFPPITPSSVLDRGTDHPTADLTGSDVGTSHPTYSLTVSSAVPGLQCPYHVERTVERSLTTSIPAPRVLEQQLLPTCALTARNMTRSYRLSSAHALQLVQLVLNPPGMLFGRCPSGSKLTLLIFSDLLLQWICSGAASWAIHLKNKPAVMVGAYSLYTSSTKTRRGSAWYGVFVLRRTVRSSDDSIHPRTVRKTLEKRLWSTMKNDRNGVSG